MLCLNIVIWICGDVASFIWPICIGYSYVPGPVLGTKDEFRGSKELSGVMAVPLSGGYLLFSGGAMVCIWFYLLRFMCWEVGPQFNSLERW